MACYRDSFTFLLLLCYLASAVFTAESGIVFVLGDEVLKVMANISIS
jgi:hypothetical protein